MKLNYLCLCLSLLLSSCDTEDKYLGKLPVKGIDSVYFNLYQGQKFDSSVPIYYEIAGANNTLISSRHFLIGTPDFDREDTRDFSTGSYDSIIYLTFFDSTTVFEAFDLRTDKHGYRDAQPELADSMIAVRLKRFNPNLRFYWKDGFAD